MQVRVLGPVEVWRDGRPVALGAGQQRTLLARLALAAPAAVAPDVLIDDVWGDAAPAEAAGALQVLVSRLRAVLEPDRPKRTPATVLVNRPPGYALDLPSDAARFAELLDRGVALLNTDDAGRAAAVLDEALGLWAGDVPYADVADEHWAQAEIARLSELRLVAREQRLAAAIALGEAGAVPALQALVERHPLREDMWRLLALALYRAGRQADALAALRAARAALADELGIDPGPALRELEAAVLAQAVELAAPAAPAARPTAAAGLVGRDAAVQAALDLADEAASGRLRLALITGEPGIGKTELAETVAGTLAARNWQVVWGRCHDSSGAPALWPWLQVLDELGPQHPLPSPLTRLRGDAGSAAGEDAAAARFAQQQAMARHLAEAAERTPLVIVLDDVQWADAESLSLLAALPDLARSARLLVLVTRRSQEGGAPVDDGLTRLARHAPLRLPLGGLAEADVAALVATTGLVLDAAELTRRTGGNPFLLRETLRSAALHGADAALLGVPEGVGDLLRQRVARLGTAAQDVLAIASVVGHQIDREAVTAVTGRGPDDVVAALDAAIADGVLQVDTSGRVQFAHDLVRETLYAEIPPLRRAALHAAVLDHLERRSGTDVSALAAQARSAGPERAAAALRWSVAAAEQAAARFAYDDAARWWQHALAAQAQLPEADVSAQVELLLRLVGAQLDAADAVSAERTRDDAVRAADDIDDPLLRIRALVALDRPTLWVVRHYARADEALVERLEIALARDDVPEVLRVRLLATLANELSYLSAGERRRALTAEALDRARPLGDPQALAFALSARFLALDADSRAWHDEVPALAAELLALDADGQAPGYALVAHLMLALFGTHSFDLELADRQAHAAERLIERLRQPLARLQHRCWLFNRALLDGRMADATDLLDDLLATDVEWWAVRSIGSIMRLLLLLQDGRAAEAEPLLPDIALIHPAIAHDAALLAQLDRGAVGDAQRDAARLPWPDVPTDWLRSAALSVRALAAAELGDVATRRAAYDALAPSSGYMLVTGTADGGPADHYLGLLARSLGESERAAAHFARLHGRAAAAGLTWWADRAATLAAALDAAGPPITSRR